MSAESGPDRPKAAWDKVLLLKNNAGRLWYRTKDGEVVVLDEAAENERDRQNDEPGTPPTDGYPEFSARIGTEEIPTTDPNEIEQKRADLEVFVQNIVDISTDLRTSLMEEVLAAEDDGDLEAIRSGIDTLLRDRAVAAGAAGAAGAAAGAAPGAGPAAGPAAPRTLAERVAEEQKRAYEQAEDKHIKDEAKRLAREQLNNVVKAEREAKEAEEFEKIKDAYKARVEQLRIHGIMDDTNAVLAQDEIAHMPTIDALKARFDTELRGLEKRLPEPPEPAIGINAVRNNAEFAQLTVEAIKNIEAILEVGGNPNSLYQRYRRRLRAGDLKQFDASLVSREKVLGKQFGIDYRSMSPAERLRIMNPPPAFANRYTENGRIDRVWMAHDRSKYGDLIPFSLEEIRTDAKKKVLYDRFLAATEYDNTLKQTVEEGKPFDDAQRQLQEYSQYEFTYQYKRAEVLSEMMTPEFTKKLMYQNDFVNSIATMYGVEKTSAFLKDDVFRIAVENLATFDRLALAAARLKNLGEGRFTAMSRGEEQYDMAEVFEERLKNTDVQTAMQKEAATGTKSVEMLPPAKEMSDEFSAATLQKYFDRDKMKAKIGDRGWDKWTASERADYKRKWEPEEIREKRKDKEAGLYAQLKRVFMEALFGEQKKQVSAH